MDHMGDLDPEFRQTCELLIKRCKDRGYILVPFYGVRSVYDQAKLWRQSRTRGEIDRIIHKLRNEGAPFLAEAVEIVGPQNGRWATNALPGQSWHQWGLALDSFVMGENGRASWSAKHPGYATYAEEARTLGLTAGYFWERQDAVHVQRHPNGVRDKHTWPQIDDAMRQKFGHLRPK